MNFQNNILQYRLCEKCNKNITKIGATLCKKCKIKPKKNTNENQDNRKIYYYKFQDRYTKSRLLLNNSSIEFGKY
jgi:hypothetical protein